MGERLRSLCALALAGTGASVLAQDGVPRLTQDGELPRPSDYAQWTFVGSGLGMTYGPAQPAPGQAPHFTNVFVNPEAYVAFNDSGRWPDGTVFVMEMRESEQNVSINNGGHTQGALVMLEASVKDSSRFPDGGWAYFMFDGAREAAAPLPRSASCYGCHAEHGAVEWTFAQFYPNLFDVARELGRVRDDYDPLRKVE